MYKVIAQLDAEDPPSLAFKSRVQLKYSGSVNETLGGLKKGDQIRCFVKWKSPTRYKNPGTPDYRKSLERQKIFFTATVYDPADCKIYQRNKSWGLNSIVLNIQDSIRKNIDSHLSAPSAKLIKALVLGDRSDFEDKDWSLFQKTGTTHLIAVSGLHLAIVGSVFYAVIVFFLKRSEKFLLLHSAKSWALLLALIPIALFVLIAGNAISAWRAWVMGLVLSLAFIFERDHDHWSSLALAFLVITFFYPEFLFSISFQLSFLAVTGLLLSRRWSHVENFWKKTSLVSMSIFIVTALCVILHFHAVSLSGVVHNLWAIPYTNFLLITALVLLCIQNFFTLSVAWTILDFSSEWFLKFLEWASHWAFQFTFYPDSVEIGVSLLASLFLVVFFLWDEWRRECLVGGVLLVLLWGIHFYHSQQKYEICFIDVGQGDAALIQSPGHHAVMIDTGGFLIPSVYQQNISFNVGENVVVPYLKTKGVKSIDRLILSHPHPDHFGGAEGILKNIPVKEVCGNGQKFPDESFDRFVKLQEEKKISSCQLKGGDVWSWEGLRWEVVYPENVNSALSLNDNSLVIRVTGQGHSFLFTGDIEKTGESLLAERMTLESEVMKVPHHASKTSSSIAFIDTIKPRYVVASLGENNFFGFPHEDILERYQRRGAQVFRTDHDGEVCFSWKPISSLNSPSSELSIQKFFSDR